MKRLLALILGALMLFAAGCAEQKAPIDVGGVSDTGGSKTVDAAFLERYVTSLEVCLTGSAELVFDDVSQLTSETLMRFFLYAINNEQEESKVGEEWLGRDGKYHLPVEDIEKLLDRYFEGEVPFEPTLIPGYDAVEDAVVLPTVTGFGGDRYVKVLKSTEQGDIVELTVGFYTDSSLSTEQFSKTYRLEKGEKNAKYLSVTKQYTDSANQVCYVGLGEGFVGYTQSGRFFSASGDSKMEKYADKISPSELLSSEYKVYSEEEPVTLTRLDSSLYEAENYRLSNTLSSLQFTGKAKSLGVLYLSGNLNPLPRAVADITDTAGEEITNSVRLVLSQNGAARAEVNITKVLVGDADGDGVPETYVCANSKRDENTNLPIGVAQKEDGSYTVASGAALYSLVLKLDGKNTEVIDSKFLREGEHVYNALIFSTDLLGLYDLNGDGTMELCMENHLFDTSVVEVVSREKDATYRTLLYNEFK